MTTIKAKKDLIHGDGSISFSKGKTYTVDAIVRTEAGLMEKNAINNQGQGQPHTIGAWWREFKIVKS